jgi:transketolase
MNHPEENAMTAAHAQERLADRAVDTARLLALDAIERARSGHPGAALSLAPVADLLFQKHIRHDPHDPAWAGRDRFVLSCGHASMLLYAQLYLTGYDLSLGDLRAFRTLHSKTPGHPEFGCTPGVDATTGPLGQGIAMAVGMAMAFKHQRAVYDPDTPEGASPFDRRVWVLASDGDLQEGVSYEAGALAGRHALDNLTVIYDDNDIQIEGPVSLTWSEDRAARFEAQGWRVSRVGRGADGDIDVDALDDALSSGHREGRPHLVVLKSEIAWPAPNARGTAASHGAPLGADEADLVRAQLGAADAAPFEISDEVLAYTRRAVDRGRDLHTAWDQQMAAWEAANPDLARQWEAATSRALPAGLAEQLPVFEVGSRLATRDASGRVIQALAAHVPELIGGSADLAEPNRTEIKASTSFLPESRAGRNIHWGVREHAMAAAMNGMLLAGGVRPYAGTFLVFSDYQRPAIRLAALMRLPAVYVWSHDSIALGQDGPTHQPIEHLSSLRAMPGLTVIRPADANETAAAWLVALEQDGPTGLALCRQPLTTLDLPIDRVTDGVRRGAYIVSDEPDPDVVLIGTGSELELALAAAARVRADGTRVRVVSMPSRELFDRQDPIYRSSVVPPSVRARVVVEAASPYGWRDIAGDAGVIVGIDHYGLSAPATDVQRECGMTVEAVVRAVSRSRASVAPH